MGEPVRARSIRYGPVPVSLGLERLRRSGHDAHGASGAGVALQRALVLDGRQRHLLLVMARAAVAAHGHDRLEVGADTAAAVGLPSTVGHESCLLSGAEIGTWDTVAGLTVG